MANDTVTQAFIEQFRSNVVHLAQQMGSRLRPAVTTVTVKAEKHNIERLQNKGAYKKTVRNALTPTAGVDAGGDQYNLDGTDSGASIAAGTVHDRRVLSMSDWQWAELLDEEDQIRMLISPNSEYAKAGAWSMGRTYDDLIIAAFNGNSTDGDGNPVAFPAGQIIDAGDAANGMTIDKLIATREAFLANDVDLDREQAHIVVGSKQMSNLLNTVEVTSADYNSVKALVRGEIDTYMGFKFHRTERLPLATSTRSCFAWCPSGMYLGVGRDIVTRIDQRYDMSYATQVYLAFTAGATRVEEEKVVQVDCHEA